jgi:hypothetical protein
VRERRVDALGGPNVARDADEVVRWGRRVVRDGHAVTDGGEPLRARETDPSRAARDEDDTTLRHCQPPQRRTALAAVIPAPNPTSRTRSPFVTLPSSSAGHSASGIDAEDVLPV